MLEFYFFVAIMALLVIGNALFKMFERRRVQLAYNTTLLALLALSAFFLSGANSTYINFFAATPFSAFFISLFAIGMLLLHLLAYSGFRGYKDFALLSSFALVGMCFVASANSLIGIFLGLELISIPSSFIILISRRNSLEAATKFFIMSSVAIALLSFAIVFVYGSANTLLLAEQQQNTLLLFALVLFFASLGFEASIFPFDVLIPDVYQGSGAFATAMLGGLNKKAGFAALIQVLILIFITSSFAFFVAVILSVLTMFYGNLVALAQDNLKCMLAYSSISQAGYILIGISVQSQAGISASLFQIFAHTFLFIGMMGIVVWLESKGKNEINDLIGLYKENAFCAAALTVFLLSFVGVPLTTGFVGKFLLFLGAINSGVAWLAIIGIINSIISIFYYVKVVSAAYTNKFGAHYMHLEWSVFFVIAFCLAVTLVFGIYPQPIIQITNSAASYLFGRAI